jgi:hypothetical protein
MHALICRVFLIFIDCLPSIPFVFFFRLNKECDSWGEVLKKREDLAREAKTYVGPSILSCPWGNPARNRISASSIL